MNFMENALYKCIIIIIIVRKHSDIWYNDKFLWLQKKNWIIH